MQSGKQKQKTVEQNDVKLTTKSGKFSVRFIVNPFAGTKPKSRIPEIIQSGINREKYDVEICLTKSAGHAEQLSIEAVENGTDIVVAVGGDGTINEVASQVIHTETVLGIIPVGSGNGLARHLGIPISPVKALQLINEATISAIDTATINGRPFVSIAGIGFDALVAEKFSSNKKRGFFSYLRIVLKEYKNYEPKRYQLKFDDGQLINTRAFFISFANSNQFGNNTLIAPQAKLDDGKLDICIVQKPRIFDMPHVANLLLLKRIHKSSLVQIIPAKGLTIKMSGRKTVNLDGEAIELKKKLEITVHPLSLNIIIPRK